MTMFFLGNSLSDTDRHRRCGREQTTGKLDNCTRYHRRTGACHTAQDNEWTENEQCWKHITTDGSDAWRHLLKTATGLVGKNECGQERSHDSAPGCACGENSEDETLKSRRAMVQRLKLERCTPSTGFQTRVQII